MKEQRKRCIENYVKAYNEFDIDQMIANLSEDIIFENVSNGEVTMRTIGLAEFKDQAIAAKQYFKQRKQTIDSWSLDDNKISISISYVAILAMDFPNGMKTGERLELSGSSVFVFDDNKIKKIVDNS